MIALCNTSKGSGTKNEASCTMPSVQVLPNFWHSTWLSLWKIIKYGKKMAINEESCHVDFISSQKPKPKFWQPNSSLIVLHLQYTQSE